MFFVSLNFPNHIVTAPDIRIIGIDSVLLDEIKKILKAFDGEKINFQYDTTFNLTGYYTSILSFVHPFLVKKGSQTR